MSSQRSYETAQLVLAAIDEINDSRGSTKEDIVEHIANEFQIPESDFKRYVPGVIEKGVAFGAIEKKYGRLVMGEVMDKMREMRRRRKRKGGEEGGGHKRRRRHHKRH